MRFVPDMYHLNTFNKRKTKGVNEWVGGNTMKITPENTMKLRES